MENKLLPLSDKTNNKPNVNLGKKQIIAIVITISLIIILLFFKTFFNSPNRLKRYLQKEEYECATNICEKDNGITIYQFNYKSGDLTVKTNEYTFIINSSNYIYTQNKDNLTCTYDNNGKIVSEEYNNASDCRKYHDAMNNIINYYNLTIEGSKFKKK